MKIMIMKYSKDSWYKDKIGKVVTVRETSKGYETKEGIISKVDVEVVER